MFPKYLKPIEVHSIYALLAGAIVSLVFWPFSIIVYCLNKSLRFLVQKAYNFFHPGKYLIADGEDAMFGVKLPGSCRALIQGFKVISGEPDLKRIQSKFEEVFTRTKGYDKLKYVLTDKYGYFCWDKSVPFDITRHVRLLDDFDPEEIVDETRLAEICMKLIPKDCCTNVKMPQWEILLIPRYRKPGELPNSEVTHYALIIRIHHAYCDGISFVLLTNNFLADSPGELPIDPMKDFNNPFWLKVYIWAKIVIVGPMNFIKYLSMLVWNPCLFGVKKYSVSKVLARSSSLDMETLRKIRFASGTSVTTITISAVYAALHRAYLKLFPGKPVPEFLHLASVGVLLPYNADKKLVNQFTMWPFTAPLNVDDTTTRLRNTHEEVRKCASQPDPVFDFYMQKALGSLPKFSHEMLFNLAGTPVMLSNVPGYKTQVKLFGGQMVDAVAWIPLVTTTGLGLSTQSYCGRMHFSGIADPQVFPTAAELKIFLEDVVNEIDIIAKAYGVHESQQTDDFLAGVLYKRKDQDKSLPSHSKDENDNQHGKLMAEVELSTPDGLKRRT